jgi:cell division protease FtsH
MTGAENDLKQVTGLARAMVTRRGMSREVGLVAVDRVADEDDLAHGRVGELGRGHREEVARAIDGAVRRIVDVVDAKAAAPLTRERARRDAPAEALLREETLDEGQLRAAVGRPGVRPRAGRRLEGRG